MAKIRYKTSVLLGIDLKSSEFYAFWFLYIVSVVILFVVGYFGLNLFPLPLLIGVILLLALLFGFFLIKYSFIPLQKRNLHLEKMLEETLHELNIPIATIKANCSMLEKSCKEEKAKRQIVRIEKALEQLLELYEEVEYLIKKEILKPKPQVFDAKEVIEERIEFFEDLLRYKQLQIELHPLQISVAKVGFKKMFDNLLSNAIKYSPKGSSIKIVLKDSLLEIEDEGKGIDEKDLIKIFERYYQENDNQEGFGIGLAMVKEFCDENGIGVYIDSKPGRGTKITLDLKKVCQ
ncbi:sensor histidine kinase [Nitratiruptor sp. SB155-2]|uniref:sensor histidine kinase n=1 Tax=Nitratiruptor sp. (strain SB155-2) TaxID=387092 RepID=UPI0011D0CEF0|nr:HAMP domain-containing sensor histidine kinase [Nitratiruptor sp. SB155-2]